jgi:hypothetical protein
MPSEDGQPTATCKGNKYLQIAPHWTVVTIKIVQFICLSVKQVAKIPYENICLKYFCIKWRE